MYMWFSAAVDVCNLGVLFTTKSWPRSSAAVDCTGRGDHAGEYFVDIARGFLEASHVFLLLHSSLIIFGTNLFPPHVLCPQSISLCSILCGGGMLHMWYVSKCPVRGGVKDFSV